MAAPMFIDPEAEENRRELQREYLDFLDDSREENLYGQKVQDLVTEGGNRLVVSINDVRRKMPKRANGLMVDSVDELICFQQALKESVATVDPEYAKNRDEFFVGFEGSFGQRHVTPRTLKSRYLGNMVCCEGIVTKCSLVRPKVVRSVHYCPATNKTVERRYTDLTSYETFPTSGAYPTQDENKNPLETEYGLSTYKDHQTFSIQELPETAPAGQLPRSVDIVADNDLSDRCKPGDRVRAVGLFRCLPSKQQGFTNGTFRTIVIANNIQLMSKETKILLASEDVSNVRKMSRNKEVFDLLSRSLAPSIHGHEEIKRAILCMLLGGQEKVLANGTRLRGDINVMLIGDPSVAKSQLLRYVLHTAPRAIATTGRGSSGVGLTAAVTTDTETGERRLEAGAMVLGDRGIVCIDEFDKMSDIDRTAIHEVMEQGRVSIAKAGIHAKLNARCAVLAAANPVYGRYDIYKNPMENIGMQDSLLSRFDLLFVLLDEHMSDRDKAIADHVIKLHRYRAAGENDGAVLEMGAAVESLTTLDLEDDRHDPAEIYEKNKGWIAGKQGEKIVTMRFLRKYIQVAKSIKSKLTDDAAAFISEKYADLRAFDTKQADRERTTPVTARTLETMIRLSTAIAKSRLSLKIERKDAEKAFNLLYFACFKEKPKERLEEEKEREARKRRREKKGDESDENSELSDQDQDETMETDNDQTKRSTRSRRQKESQDTVTEDSLDLEPTIKRIRRASGEKGEIPSISVDRYKTFRRHVRSVFDGSQEQEPKPLDEVMDAIQISMGSNKFRQSEIDAALERLQDENAAMISQVDNTLMLI